DRLRPSRKRYLLVDSDKVGVSPPDALRMRSQATLDTLVPEEDDGVAAYVLRLPPYGTAVGPNPSVCGGQYYVIVNGEMLWGETPLSLLSCVFVSNEEESAQIVAGDAGLEVLVLQFPRSIVPAPA